MATKVKAITKLERLLTVDEVADYLSIYRETAARYIRERKIKSTKIGDGAVRVHPQDLLDYMNKQRGMKEDNDEMSVEEMKEFYKKEESK